MTQSSAYHIPVLLSESVDGMIHNPEGVYVDVTFGGGGHSRYILSQLSEGGRLISFDQDPDALENMIEDDRFSFVHQNFGFLKNNLRLQGCREVDGILADLGVSSHQFDTPERGFSFRFDADLDMRMNQVSDKTAEVVVNEYSEDQLRGMFKEFGELREAGRISRLIVGARKDSRIKTVGQLVELLSPLSPAQKRNTFLAKVFQAIRIEVNEEMEVLKGLLEQGLSCLKDGGVFSVITYHSLEDRLVKNFFKTGNFRGEVVKDFFGNIERPMELVNRKPIVPSDEEMVENTRARSAKLRIAKKVVK